MKVSNLLGKYVADSEEYDGFKKIRANGLNDLLIQELLDFSTDMINGYFMKPVEMKALHKLMISKKEMKKNTFFFSREGLSFTVC